MASPRADKVRGQREKEDSRLLRNFSRTGGRGGVWGRGISGLGLFTVSSLEILQEVRREEEGRRWSLLHSSSRVPL